jgi:hypothetical protein
MAGELIPPGSVAFKQKFHQFRYSVFRLETLQDYAGSGEDAALDAFHSGASTPQAQPGKDAWTAMIRGNVAAGRTLQRVHVVTEPITPYMQFELTWAYQPNVAAGEDIRIISVGEGEPWPPSLPEGTDFWLFDSTHLYAMQYTPDGAWLGTEPVSDPARIVQACAWRDAALHYGSPWASYIAQHPELARRMESLSKDS